jgi:hypothetical protein
MADKTAKLERTLKLADSQYRKDSESRIKKLKAQPKVGVYGNPLYKDFLGKTYSFLYQDFPVSITFDGKTYMYPKTIAELLQKKLDAAARANAPKEINEVVVV